MQQSLSFLSKTVFMCLIVLFEITQCYTVAQKKDKQNLTGYDILINHRLNAADDLQMGSSIDGNFVSFTKLTLQQACVIYGNSTDSTVRYLNQKFQQSYPGNWIISFLTSPINQSVILIPTKDFESITYSVNGTWWFYAKAGFNKYVPSYSYFLSRMSILPSNDTFRYIYWNSRPINNTVITDIVNYAQVTTPTLLDQLNQIEDKLQIALPGKNYNLFMGNFTYVNIYAYGYIQFDSFIRPTIKNQYFFMAY